MMAYVTPVKVLFNPKGNCWPRGSCMVCLVHILEEQSGRFGTFSCYSAHAQLKLCSCLLMELSVKYFLVVLD